MKSVALSLGTHIHSWTYPHNEKSINGLHTVESSNCIKLYKSQNQPQPLRVQKVNEDPLSRREALGISFFSLVILQFPQSASAADEFCEFTETPSGLAYCDKVVGNGPQPVKGQLIKAHYVGRLEDGKVFDSSYNRGKPLSFHIGVGEVIKGWDEGILGGDGLPAMLPGGKRKLRIPPQLGYGIRGAGCRGGTCIIPPDSVLLFDVEFIGKA